MITTHNMGFSTPKNKDRILTLAITAVVTLLMFGLAYTASAATLYRQLDVGMTGSDVSDLQTFLAADASVYPQGLVTGYFGSLTSAAVSRFQTKNGLPSVGRVGPLTLATINAQMNGGVGGLDVSAPVIYTLGVTPAQSTAVFNWNTTENATGIVYYSSLPLAMAEGNGTMGVAISGSSVLANTNLQTTHSTTLSGLNPNTTYYYVVYAKDGAGNENITWPTTFTTTN